MSGGLSEHEVEDLRAICETVLPAGPAGPGAGEAGVVAYIVGQLAGEWGGGARMYRDPPFAAPAHEGHGWQSPMTPLEVYRYGLGVLAEHCRSRYGASPSGLGVAELEDLVEAWVDGRVAGFDDVASEAFFAMVRDNVAEGLFSDPRYGGNRGLIGWRWLGYPGVAEAHGGYADAIADHDAPFVAEPKGLSWR